MTHARSPIPLLAWLALAATGLLGPIGCGSVPGGASAASYPTEVDRFVRAQQGEIVALDARLAPIRQRLQKTLGPAQRLTLVQMTAGAPGAFALRPNTIVVTTELLDWCTDEQVAAALAHELGHLIDDDHVQPRYALAEELGVEGTDIERRADQIGRRVLAAAGYEPSAMSGLLRRLAQSPALALPVRAALMQRCRDLAERGEALAHADR